MRFLSLAVENFRAIGEARADDLRDVVVIAGPNGCGKTCLLDAIRLLKSAYGGSRSNEWHQFFGELQIDISKRDQVVRLLRDPSRPLRVQATVRLAGAERNFVLQNASQLVADVLWRERLQGRRRAPAIGDVLDGEYLALGGQIERDARQFAEPIIEALQSGDTFDLSLSVSPSGNLEISPSPAVQICFETTDSPHLGVIDYYSAQRRYVRESISGVNLNLDQYRDQYTQSLLYNQDNKFANLKSQLAAGYIGDLIAKEAGAPAAPNSLQSSLTELFELFFAGKDFAGVVPTADGIPTFPVTLSDGSSHDIDELSSGEKEIVYGYLRLRNAGSKHSVLLLDEPELHLNPKLLRGLADFYRRHISVPLDSQIWMVTHADTLVRESVGRVSFSVFHMQAATHSLDNQLRRLAVRTDADSVVVDLVGSLPGFLPGAPMLVLEGEQDTDFDVDLVGRLFPEVEERCNLVSGGSKRRSTDLYELINESATAGSALGGPAFAIVDGDFDLRTASNSITQWDAYHIENYLLHEGFILETLTLMLGSQPFVDELEVERNLKTSARAVLPRMLQHQVRLELDRELSASLNLKFDPAETQLAHAFAAAVNRSAERFTAKAAELTESEIGTRVARLEQRHLDELDTDEWRRTYPGRDILKHFAGQLRLSYTTFRNVLIGQMQLARFRPAGMEATLRRAMPPEVFA